MARQFVPLTGAVLDSTASTWPLHSPVPAGYLANVGSIPLMMFHCSENGVVSVRGMSIVPKLPSRELSQYSFGGPTVNRCASACFDHLVPDKVRMYHASSTCSTARGTCTLMEAVVFAVGAVTGTV